MQVGRLCQRCVAAAVSVALASCALTPTNFEAGRYSATDEKVCRTWKSAQQGQDLEFLGNVNSEIGRRGLSAERCSKILADAAAGAAVAAVAIVGVALLVAAAKRGGGGGGGSAASDYQWEWDEFIGDAYQRVWACRGVQTGQFADQGRCAGKAQIDWKWPGLTAPRF